MKRCPQCGREYDSTMMFCLDDGTELLYGPASMDEPATLILSEPVAKAAGFQSDETKSHHHDDETFWVAVNEFKFDGTDADIAALSSGLSEGIVAGLARFSYLKVVSENALKAAKPSYIIDGVLRKSGSMLRFNVQAVQSSDGANLWSEKFDLAFEAEKIFEMQDTLVPQIVSAIGGIYGVLPRTMGERLRSRAIDELTPYEALVRSFDYFERVTPAEWRVCLDGVEAALETAPDYTALRAMRALLLIQGFAQGFDPSEDSLELGRNEARRAIEESSSDHLAWFALAQALFFKKEFVSLPTAVKRSLALNPMDANATALFGEFISYSGDWDWGLKLAAAARELNPNFPGWYWHTNFNDAFRRREYQEARDIAVKMSINSSWGAHVLTASVLGHLGENELAVQAFHQAEKIRPHLTPLVNRELHIWFRDEHAGHLKEGLLKAGIDVG